MKNGGGKPGMKGMPKPMTESDLRKLNEKTVEMCAPIKTEVSPPLLRFQQSAICDRVWPRSLAILFSFRIVCRPFRFGISFRQLCAFFTPFLKIVSGRLSSARPPEVPGAFRAGRRSRGPTFPLSPRPWPCRSTRALRPLSRAEPPL